MIKQALLFYTLFIFSYTTVMVVKPFDLLLAGAPSGQFRKVRVATGFVTRVQSGRLEVLMLKLSPYVYRATGNKWAFPGGLIDQNENPIDGFVREFFEECVVGMQLEGWTTSKTMNEIRDTFIDFPYAINVPNGAAYNAATKRMDKPIELWYFYCTLKDPNTPISLSYEHTEYRWVPIEQFLHNVTAEDLAPYMYPFINERAVQSGIERVYREMMPSSSVEGVKRPRPEEQ